MQRSMCTEPQGLVADVAATIVEAKEYIAAPVVPLYPKAKFEADMKAGTVDMALLGSMFEWDPEIRKNVMSKAAAHVKLVKEAAKPPPEMDWDKYSSLSSQDAVAALKTAYTASVPKYMESVDKQIDAMKAESMSKVQAIETALAADSKAAEKAKDEGLLDLVAKLELLHNQLGNVKSLTIAEILEQEPELRAEIEEEIKNNVWSP